MIVRPSELVQDKPQNLVMLPLRFLSHDLRPRSRLFHLMLGENLIDDLLAELFGVSVGHVVVQLFLALDNV